MYVCRQEACDKKHVTLNSNLIQTKELEKQSKVQLDNLSDTQYFF